MPLVDVEKTTYKFKYVVAAIIVAFGLGGAAWRFETKMTNVEKSSTDAINSLRNEIVYKYTLELLKINNRLDVFEAKSFVQRSNFKKDTLSLNNSNLVQKITKTDNQHPEREKYPQVCMVVVRVPEFKRKRLIPIKILLS